MNIPTVYILFSIELFLILSGIGIYILIRRRKSNKEEPKEKAETNENIDISNTYIDFLEQEITRQNELNNTEDLTDSTDKEKAETSLNNNSENINEETKLLKIRSQFLDIEKEAAEIGENEDEFWKKIIYGMQTIVDELTVTDKASTEANSDDTNQQPEKNKIIGVEDQGKKVDAEVNKLKDIISGQEHTLSDLQKALKNAKDSSGDNGDFENSEGFQELKTQIDNFERQINDSKICMEVLEMENNRLQEEVDALQKQYNELFKQQGEVENENSTSSKTENSQTQKNLGQMQEVLDQQEKKINDLLTTIDELQLSTDQSEKLKSTIEEFSRSSKDMMSCITILEEENEHLQETIANNKPDNTSPATMEESSEPKQEISKLKSQIKSHEKEVIKKDVAYAKLQDELSTMEKEYQAIYEQLHGN